MTHFQKLSLPAVCLLMLACAGCWNEIPQAPRGSSTPTTSQKLSADLPEDAENQNDDPLASVLTSKADIRPQAEAPATPAEFNGFDEKPAESTTTDIKTKTRPPTRTAFAAWRMGSKWSLAAAYFAKGPDADRYREPLEQATYAARLLDLDLPPLPDQQDPAVLQKTVVRYLLEASGPQLLEELSDRFPPNHAALTELALKTHLLLLVYTPSNERVDPLITSIRLAATNSGLPESVWQETVDLLEQRAEFARVKQAVFQLHRRAVDYLSGSAPSAETKN